MRKFSLLVLLLSLFSPSSVLAQDNERFITIVNPVRISSYTKDPTKSLKSEYAVIRERDLPATWLLTYDALDNPGIITLVKSMDEKQEPGTFLEVTPAFAKGAGVEYHDTGFWHHASSVFLSGYTQDERKLLIDTVFEKFKSVFGYYPASVGSWWTDSFSLSYMKEKYAITANLVCSDQFSTDGYQLWGQPWGVPYYPSKFYAAVPASSGSVKLDIVNIQWAPRDPLNGYDSSLYSTQDYLLASKPQDISYFRKLVEFYSSYGQVTVGLESDLGPAGYGGEFAKQMDVVAEEMKNGIGVVTMSDFSEWYREKYPNLSPSVLLEAEDFLGSGVKAVWSQSPEYRLFYTIDPETHEITVRDLRFYNANLEEPYYYSPNRSFNLTINISAAVDEISFKEGIKKLKPETKNIIEKFAKEKFTVPLGGVLVKGLSAEAIHFFRQKKAILSLLTGKGWNYFNKIDYLIPQGESYALDFLSKMPSGKVMVYNNECLQCEYHTKYKPPAFANLRGYVRKYGKHPIVYNSSVIKAKTREEARKEFNKLKMKYVYLVKFESYFEQLPFSPGDLNVEKIFSNANAEIWSVK